MTLVRQVRLLVAGAVAVAVVLAGVVGVGLVRHSYDGEAQRSLHRQALLISRLADRTGGQNPTAAQRVRRLLGQAGITVVRVQSTGAHTGQADAADLSSAAAGRAVQAVRGSGDRRRFVDVEPVEGGGGVVVSQAAGGGLPGGVLPRLLLALVVGLVVAAALGSWLARRAARPLAEAAAAAHRLAAGERAVRLVEDGPFEVAEVARGFNGLAGALERSEGRQRDFLLSVSHELRTPLTAITGFAEALADGVAPDAASAGRTIGAEAARLDRLVTDLLELARVGADDFRLDLAEVDLRGLVEQTELAWRLQCEAVRVLLRVEVPAGPVVVTTDAGRVRQVLDGLLANALRVVPAGQPIVLGLERLPSAARLQVRDGGPGLADADLDVAFERGVLHERYRGIRPSGTGVGLALVAGLVRRLGGSTWAGRAPEGGAAFTLDLPARPGTD